MYPLTTDDVQAVLGAAADLLAVPEADELPDAVLEVVDRLVPSDTRSYNEIDIARGRARIVAVGPQPDPGAAAWFAEHARENPIIAHQERSGDLAAIRISDLIGARELHRRPIYHLIYRPLGTEHQLALGLAGPDGAVTGVALNRHRLDFSDRDVAVLELLRPMLAQIIVARGGPARPWSPRPVLTPRQREIVGLLAAGATNAQIAAALGITARTVAKHLEHVYRALGVTNRTSAAAHIRDCAY